LLILGVAASIKIALANILLGLASLLWLAALVRGLARRPRASILVPVAAYAVVSVLSALLSTDPRQSVANLADLCTLVLVPMTMSLLNHDRWHRLLTLLALVLVVSSAFGLAQYTLVENPLQLRIRGLANHYMTFSGWNLVVTLLLLGQVFFAPGRRSLLWGMPAGLGLATLLLGLTRGAWIGLATGILLALAIGRPRTLVLLPLAAPILFFVVPTAVLSRAASTIDMKNAASRERIHMLRSGLRMAHDHPVLGVGPGLVQPKYAELRPPEAPSRIPHLHINVVQIAAERGSAGLLAYLGILGAFAIHAWRFSQNAQAPARPMIIGCLMAVGGVTAAGFFEYNWGDAEVWIVTLVSLSAPFSVSVREAA
jgi:O-antigen ligase